MATIWCVCKDAGGTNGLLPVARELRAMGHSVTLVANEGSPSVGILRATGEKPIAGGTVMEMAEDGACPMAIVTDMSTGGGVGRDLIPLLPHNCMTFALQDYWGGGLMNEWREPKFRPGAILVGDNIGAEAVRAAWPEFNPERIVATGYPALDKYARAGGIVAEAERMKTAHAVEFVPSVFYAGSTFNGRGLRCLVEAIEGTHRRVDLIARPHPGMKQNEPEEVPVWEDAERRYRKLGAGYKIVAPSREEWSTPSLIAAADVTVSAYSTCLLEAVMLRKPNITLWTSEVREAFMSKERGFGGLLNGFPPATLGCTEQAENADELADLLALSFAGGLDLSVAQERHYPADGKNARRAAEFIHRQVSTNERRKTG